MKEKIKNVIAAAFLILWFLFIAVASIWIPAYEPDPMLQKIKEESMISGGFGGY